MKRQLAGQRGIPNNGPHWATQLRRMIRKTGFKGTWKEAIEELWHPRKNPNKPKKKVFILPFPNKKNLIDDVIKREKKPISFGFCRTFIAEIQLIIISYQNRNVCEIFEPLMTNKNKGLVRMVKMNTMFDDLAITKIDKNSALYSDTQHLLNQTLTFTSDGFLVFTEEFVSLVKKSIDEYNEKPKKRFILINMNIEEPRANHQNLVIIDKKEYKLYLYEPNGLNQTNYYSDFREQLRNFSLMLDLNFARRTTNVFSDDLDQDIFRKGLTEKEKIIFDDIFDFSSGLQTLERFGNSKYADFKGLCQVISTFFGHLVVLNPNMPIEDIMPHFLNEMEHNLDNIQRYILYYAYEMIKQKNNIIGTSFSFNTLLEKIKKHEK